MSVCVSVAILWLLHSMYFFIVCFYTLAYVVISLLICISLYCFMPFCIFLYNCGLFVVISYFFVTMVHTVYCLCTELLWTPFFCGQFFSYRSKHSNTVKMTVSIFTNTNLTMIHTDQDTNLLILFYVICIFLHDFLLFVVILKSQIRSISVIISFSI